MFVSFSTSSSEIVAPLVHKRASFYALALMKNKSKDIIFHTQTHDGILKKLTWAGQLIFCHFIRNIITTIEKAFISIFFLKYKWFSYETILCYLGEKTHLEIRVFQMDKGFAFAVLDIWRVSVGIRCLLFPYITLMVAVPMTNIRRTINLLAFYHKMPSLMCTYAWREHTSFEKGLSERIKLFSACII